MNDGFGLAGGSGGDDQHRRCVWCWRERETLVSGHVEERFPRLDTVVFEGSVDDNALIRREDCGVNPSNIVVEAGLANVERWFQPLQNGSEFGGFERSSQGRRDRPQLKA